MIPPARIEKKPGHSPASVHPWITDIAIGLAFTVVAAGAAAATAWANCGSSFWEAHDGTEFLYRWGALEVQYRCFAPAESVGESNAALEATSTSRLGWPLRFAELDVDHPWSRPASGTITVSEPYFSPRVIFEHPDRVRLNAASLVADLLLFTLVGRSLRMTVIARRKRRENVVQ